MNTEQMEYFPAFLMLSSVLAINYRLRKSSVWTLCHPEKADQLKPDVGLSTKTFYPVIQVLTDRKALMSPITVKVGIERTLGSVSCSNDRNGNSVIAVVFLLSVLKLS